MPDDATIVDWCRPGPSITEFHQSSAYVRVLLGGRGAGKTSGGSCLDAIGHCWHNAGAKVLFVRKTETSQASSTIETLMSVCNQMGTLYEEGPGSLFRSWNNGLTVRVPSRLAVERYNEFLLTNPDKSAVAEWLSSVGDRLCGYIQMKGLPSGAQAANNLRGFECSRLIFVEADQISERDFQLALACLRWKGSDPETCDANGFIRDAGCVLDTNPPSPRHWIAQMEAREMAKPPEERDMEFWHISTYENQHNLPEDYIERLILMPYQGNTAMIERMLWGRYADAYDGDPVVWAFRVEDHAGDDLPWPSGAYLVRGWDFGTRNAVVWSAYWRDGDDEYWHDLHEQYLEGSDTERQVIAAKAQTEEHFPFWNDRSICAGVLDYCDPAGANSNFGAQVAVGDKLMKGSSTTIMQSHGIFPGMNMWTRSLQITLTICNRLMQKKDRFGNPVYRVDRKSCPILYRALSGEYRYPKVGDPGYGSGAPLKGELCGNVDHIHDAGRYAKINCLRLIREEYEQTQKPAFSGTRRKNPNPAKRY